MKRLTVHRSSFWVAACDILHTAVDRRQREQYLGTETHLQTTFTKSQSVNQSASVATVPPVRT